ncbi:MAG: hypothetical protein VXY65_01170 [Actinomycetota bacterium]|nr:hypothetical protein [Acidimicrobiaceae bacterium]MEC7457129.1 hypothetical protein [Actinomycetota bacterium]MEC7666075.1 hypothetical protein [Actinomycetota bacterium]MEC8018952.1 hypothetical protein [Actinomycetota bacterium]MEC8485658.1 hypothetical protein [Actinomycetota bacterium]
MTSESIDEIPLRPWWGRASIGVFVALVICTNIAAITWARLVLSSPETLLALSSRNRYLALVLGTDISGVAYWLIGSSRIAIAFVVCHLAGRAYGDQILALFVKYLGVDEPTIARLRAGFTKADWALIPFFVGSNIVAAISGIQRTATTKLAALIAIGLIARLALIQWLANIFNEQLTDAINVLQKYSWWFVGGSIILVLFANARNARRS